MIADFVCFWFSIALYEETFIYGLPANMAFSNAKQRTIALFDSIWTLIWSCISLPISVIVGLVATAIINMYQPETIPLDLIIIRVVMIIATFIILAIANQLLKPQVMNMIGVYNLVQRIRPTPPPPPPPPPGCPFLFVFTGQEFVDEGKLNIHNPEGYDILLDHELANHPEPVNHKYHLRLVEESHHFSEIDRVKLYAVLDNGRIVSLPLLSAVHSRDGNVARVLRRSDDKRTAIYGKGYDGFETSDSILPGFLANEFIESHVVNFIFHIEGHNSKIM